MSDTYKTNILVVDDQPQNLFVLEAILDNPNYEVVTAHSGHEALQHLDQQEFALALLDIQMPGINGFETAKLIRQNPKIADLPIIFLTAEFDDIEDMLHGYSLNAVDYVLKPFIRKILQAKVSVFVELHQKTQQLRRQATQLKESEGRLAKRTQKLELLNFQYQQEIERHKQTTYALKHQSQQLEATNQELETFSYTVSHDLRSPLTVINLTAQRIKRKHKEQLSENGQEGLERIVNTTMQMAKMVEDLLSYSSFGPQSISYQPISLVDKFAKIKDHVHVALEQLGGEIIVSPDLPTIESNPTLVYQIFSNLVENAITYRKPEVSPRVEISIVDSNGLGDKPASKANDAFVTICVADNGIGIAKESQDKIFDVFQRLHGQETYTGTGIGLATVKKAVSLLGGCVWVESVEDEGSRFYVRLPKVP